MLASQEGHDGCVEVLLRHGADPNLACSSEWPQLPIHAAAEFGHPRYGVPSRCPLRVLWGSGQAVVSDAL